MTGGFCSFGKEYIFISLVWVKVIMFNDTFNNISAISWLSVLLVEEYPVKTTDMSQVTDCIGSYKSNYHTIPTTTTPISLVNG